MCDSHNFGLMEGPWRGQRSEKNISNNIDFSFTCLNFYHLDIKNVPEVWDSSFNPVLYVDFRGVISFSVKVWSWKIFQFFISLAFRAAICRSAVQNNRIHALLSGMPELPGGCPGVPKCIKNNCLWSCKGLSSFFENKNFHLFVFRHFSLK